MTALCLDARVSSLNLQHFCCRWLMPLLRICEEMSAGSLDNTTAPPVWMGGTDSLIIYNFLLVAITQTKNTMYIYAEKYNVFFLFIELVRQINNAQAGANVVEHVEVVHSDVTRNSRAAIHFRQHGRCDVALLNGWSETLCCSIDTNLSRIVQCLLSLQILQWPVLARTRQHCACLMWTGL